MQKDIAQECFTDQAMVEVARANPLGPHPGAPRLRTALSMGFQAPEYFAANLNLMKSPVLIFHGAKDTVCRL